MLLVWGGCFARAVAVFGTDSAYVQPFNSDSALPVLMANDPVIDTFRTYIYGQDQIGAWPFLLCQLVSRATGHLWTDRDIYVWQTLWLFLGCFAVAALSRRCRFVPALLFLATLCLHPTVSHYLFVINQRNAWQVTAIFFAWWCLRRLVARRNIVHNGGGGVAIQWSLATFCFALLAAWTSPLSAPALCVVFALEWLRARASRRHPNTVQRDTLVALLTTALPFAAALICEQLLKANYHRFALKRFGSDFRTPVEFDRGHLWANLHTQLELFISYPQWPLTALAVLLAPLLIYLLLRGGAHDERVRRSRAHATGARLDLCVLSLGCLAVAAVNFVSTVVFSWTRLNAYGPRYLALTHLFGTLGGLFALLLLVILPRKIDAARRKVLTACALIATLCLALRFPPIRTNPDYQKLKEVADELTRRAPRRVLLGGYWDTYVFPALHPGAALVPIPAADQLMRTPWTANALRAAGQMVLVVHHTFPPTNAPETPGAYTTFGDGQAPPASIRQYGTTLQLVTPRWYEQHGYTFSLYRKVDTDTATPSGEQATVAR